VLAAAGAALAYGLTIVQGRTLAKAHLGAPTALGSRFAIASLGALTLLALRRAPLLPVRGERAAVFLLGALGYTAESTLFFMGLERGTAAAVALLFYVYPAVVTVVELAAGWAPARGRTVAALALSLTGTALVVATGSHVAISAVGVLCALGAAGTFAAYALVSTRVVRATDALTTAAWVAGGAAVSLLGRGLLTGELRSPAGHVPALLAYGLETAVAFALMFVALARLGASRTAVVMTLEAFFAVVLGAAVLGEHLSAGQVVGGAAILAATAVIALTRVELGRTGTGRARTVPTT
jgi:drug/metabolite transporter (DMT)-like permease